MPTSSIKLEYMDIVLSDGLFLYSRECRPTRMTTCRSIINAVLADERFLRRRTKGILRDDGKPFARWRSNFALPILKRIHQLRVIGFFGYFSDGSVLRFSRRGRLMWKKGGA